MVKTWTLTICFKVESCVTQISGACSRVLHKKSLPLQVVILYVQVSHSILSPLKVCTFWLSLESHVLQHHTAVFDCLESLFNVGKARTFVAAQRFLGGFKIVRLVSQNLFLSLWEKFFSCLSKVNSRVSEAYVYLKLFFLFLTLVCHPWWNNYLGHWRKDAKALLVTDCKVVLRLGWGT